MAQQRSTSQSDQGGVPEWLAGPAGGNGDGTQDAPLSGDLVDPDMMAMIAATPAMQTVIEFCAEMCTVDDDSTAAAMEQMMARVLASTSAEDVFAEELTVPAENVLDIPMVLHGFRVGMTEYAEGFPYYALLDVEYGQPKARHVVTIGAFKVMGQLVALYKIGEWPQVVKIQPSKKATRAGYRPLSLTRAV